MKEVQDERHTFG